VKQPQLPISNDLPLIPSFQSVTAWGPYANRMLLHEPLIAWATEEWKQRYGDDECIVLWTSGDCINRLALKRVKPGRKIGPFGTYVGFEPIVCPLALPTNWRTFVKGEGIVPAGSSGAMLFTFVADGQTFPVLYACVAYHSSTGELGVTPIALCPPAALNLYNSFESLCQKAISKRVEPGPKIQVIGGPEDTFDTRVEWDDVILAQALKDDIKHEMNAFFGPGVQLYQELKLPPFRKLLLVGPPGGGKSTLCAALAKQAIQRKYLVIYVSASDIHGASFQKIHYALRIVAEAKYPTLLIIEELDVYLRAQDKSQILNVLDGLEAPNNPRGVLMIATTNYPEVIDERIAKRPGRIDRIVFIPPIQDLTQAEQMLRRYMSAAYHEDHALALPRLIGKTGAFVREVSLHARMSALYDGIARVSLDMVQQSITRLETQLATALESSED
jgi:hypothetical protein